MSRRRPWSAPPPGNGRVPSGIGRASRRFAKHQNMEGNMRMQYKLGAAILAAALLGAAARVGAEIRRHAADRDARRAAEHRSLLQQPAHRRGDAPPGLGHAGLSQSGHLQDRAAARDRVEAAGSRPRSSSRCGRASNSTTAAPFTADDVVYTHQPRRRSGEPGVDAVELQLDRQGREDRRSLGARQAEAADARRRWNTSRW